MYHTISHQPYSFPDWCVVEDASFKRQMKYLLKYFDLLSLHDALDRCLTGKLHRPTAVITFDDGYQSNFDVAFPILKELNIPATIFLTTGFLDTEDTLWMGRVNTALANCEKTAFHWRGRQFILETPEDRGRASRSIQYLIKQMSPRTLEKELKCLVEYLGHDSASPIGLDSPFRMLDSRSIHEMLKSDLILFGAHTHSHQILKHLSEEDQNTQIVKSLESIEDLTGGPCKIFAYPNGQKQDYSQNTVTLLRECGVELAVTSIEGLNNPSSPLLELRRIGIGGKW
jgi:peptidoglycan/xylan/chitin deacetylase (PgdA/CDA1 family)